MGSGGSETPAHAWTVRLPGLSEVGNDRVVPVRAMGVKACGALSAVIIILHHRVSLEAISLALLNPVIAGAVFSEVRLGCAVHLRGMQPADPGSRVWALPLQGSRRCSWNHSQSARAASVGGEVDDHGVNAMTAKFTYRT